MHNERVILCGDLTRVTDAEGTTITPSREPVLLRLWGPGQTVNLKVRQICDALAKTLPGRFLDLIELATYVYCADQTVARGGDVAVDVLGAKWRRTLRFAVPVRDLKFWRRAEVVEALSQTLGFLSEDEYHFDFQHLVNPPGQQLYIEGSGDFRPGTEPQEVVLFSGGLDSLGGAVQEAVVERRRVTLVTHRPTEKLRKRQERLCSILDAKAAPVTPLYVPVTINKDKGLGREYTQRSRSFLYACLAATVAHLHGLRQIRFYENGVVSLNLPLSPQVVGAKATRTTHPRVLDGFGRILSLVTEGEFRVQNPFLWKTKADVVRLIAEAGCAEAIAHSTSCTHTWEMADPQFHCGTCSQCIDRRFAVLAAGQGAHDPANGYRVDLLAGARSPGEHRTMLAAYVETALAVDKMDPLAFFSRYGEVARVVRHLDLPSADLAALRVFELYQRHAKAVGRVVDDGIAQHDTQIRSRELPKDCLLRLVCDTSSANGQVIYRDVKDDGEALKAAPFVTADYAFRRKGQFWVVRFAGAEEFFVEASQGATYLHLLLSSRGKPQSVVDLVLQVAGRAELSVAVGNAGERSDADALADYRQQYLELTEELDEAKAIGDFATVERLTGERKAFAEQLKAVGLGGRRKSEADDLKRIRQAFQKAVKRAIGVIERYDRAGAAHLRASVSCGQHPVYDPVEQVEWDL